MIGLETVGHLLALSIGVVIVGTLAYTVAVVWLADRRHRTDADLETSEWSPIPYNAARKPQLRYRSQGEDDG